MSGWLKETVENGHKMKNRILPALKSIKENAKQYYPKPQRDRIE
jgi:hypothetical protein